MFQIICDTKKEPDPMSKSSKRLEINTSWLLSKFVTWVVLWKFNDFDKMWDTDNKTKSMEFGNVKKTLETYLPPIDSKITDFKTICKYLKYLQGLAADANMPFANAALDVGAAINACKVIWNYPQRFANFLLKLGDFDFMKENYKTGKQHFL